MPLQSIIKEDAIQRLARFFDEAYNTDLDTLENVIKIYCNIGQEGI